jgi:hypothetical protein
MSAGEAQWLQRLQQLSKGMTKGQASMLQNIAGKLKKQNKAGKKKSSTTTK